MLTHEEYVAKYTGNYFYAVFAIVSIIIGLSVLGIFGNANIVWATCRKKSLRYNCNILIAVTAFTDIIHQCSHFIFGYWIFSARNFTTMESCYWQQFASVFMMNVGSFLMLSVGVDRLISVLVPLKYDRISSTPYMVFMLLCPLVYSSWLNFMAYLAMRDDPQGEVICVIAEGYHSWSKATWGKAMNALNISIIITYVLVWVMIWIRSGTVNRRIIRCLTVVMLLVLGGSFLTFMAMGVALKMGLDEEQLFQVHLYAGSTVNLSITLNYPVYFLMNKEYRAAFREQIYMLAGCTLHPQRKFVTTSVAQSSHGKGTISATHPSNGTIQSTREDPETGH